MRYYILSLATAMLFSCTHGDTKQNVSEIKKADTSSTEKQDTVNNSMAVQTTDQPLVLTPLDTEGDMGWVTFTQKGKTIFYYDAKTKTGKINLNGVDHVLTKLEGSYKISGKDLSITTTKGKWAEMVSDCAYGKSLVVTIKMGAQELKLDNVEVQDCSGMVE